MARKPDENDYLKRLGMNLKRIRQSKNISQYKLGMETETDASYVRKIESGKQNVTLLSLLNISKALGIDIKELLP